MRQLLFDAGALVGLERDDRDAWGLLRRDLLAGMVPVVPGVVLAQVWRGGGRQARLGQALRYVRELPVQPAECRAAGVLCRQTGTADVVDALVVVLADRLHCDIVTSDPGDIGPLVAAAGSRSRVLAL